MILLGYSEIRTGSTLLTATLGFDDEQLATTTEHWGQVPAKNVANEVITPLGGLSFNNGDFGGTAVRDKQRAASIDNRWDLLTPQEWDLTTAAPSCPPSFGSWGALNAFTSIVGMWYPNTSYLEGASTASADT
jgi:hypothetical protein